MFKRMLSALTSVMKAEIAAEYLSFFGSAVRVDLIHSAVSFVLKTYKIYHLNHF